MVSKGLAGGTACLPSDATKRPGCCARGPDEEGRVKDDAAPKRGHSPGSMTSEVLELGLALGDEGGHAFFLIL